MQKIKTLTILWGSYHGGVETAMLNRMRQLKKYGWEGHLYFYYEGKGLSQFHDIPHQVSPEKTDLADYIKKHDFHIITFVNTLHNMTLLRDIEYKGKILFELHGFAQSITEELNSINENKEGGLISGIVVPGDYVASFVRSAIWKRPELPIIVARNMVDFDVFQPTPYNYSELGQFGLWVKNPIIGWVGRISRDKGWRPLLRVFKLMKDKNPKLKLLIIGDMTVSQDYKKFCLLVRKHQLTSSIGIISNVDHYKMAQLYTLISASGGLLLSTSYTEGYPYHLLEAQACGCPIVCTNIGGSTEVVSHGSTGLIYNIGNDQMAAGMVSKVISDHSLRAELIGSAMKQVRHLCGFEKNTNYYISELSRILHDIHDKQDKSSDKLQSVLFNPNTLHYEVPWISALQKE